MSTDPSIPAGAVRCPRCGGEGEYEAQHPSYGSTTCPSPTQLTPCGRCNGRGYIWK